MTSSDAGATLSSINSPTAPSPMPTLSPAPSLTLSPVSTTSDNSNHRPFAGGLLRLNPSPKPFYRAFGRFARSPCPADRQGQIALSPELRDDEIAHLIHHGL